MRLLAIVEYDGTDFAGFQLQRNQRTVQGELERALHKITGDAKRIRVMGAGRTDAGVHASGQGAHFDSAWEKPLEILHRALNAVLPNDISIRSLTQVAPDFSARYNATSRTYRYTILNHVIRSPLNERYALLVSEPLDVDAMNAAARCLIGEKDFGAFGTPPRGDNTVRRVYRAQVERHGDQVLIEIEANAFLYRMVRRIVGTLLQVGKGTLSIAEFSQVLERKIRAGEAVPPQGLCLTQVKYERQVTRIG
ncbi:MAG: tRNA pseudouridine(38-40) synthase TruA [Chloroflexi bacterium]|nr:tRNA pseudouridine(38-40) synthase TruA [Chloroflexota bacterium]